MTIDTDVDGPEVVLLDTSTAVALILEDHEGHNATISALRGRRLGLSGHAWFETYSVLTRLPSGQRRSPADVLRILARNFPASGFLGELESAALGREVAELGISGGAIYDALVGAAAREHRKQLFSRDVRAGPVYDALNVDVEFIS
jgi:predicted nucleic acid-binding protein